MAADDCEGVCEGEWMEGDEEGAAGFFSVFAAGVLADKFDTFGDELRGGGDGVGA